MSLKKKFLKSKPICKVTFSLPKEAVNGAKEVKVLGEFNNWNWENAVPMRKKDKDFITTVELEKNKRFQFRYVIDNQQWENDWAADEYEHNAYGTDNSVVVT